MKSSLCTVAFRGMNGPVLLVAFGSLNVWAKPIECAPGISGRLPGSAMTRNAPQASDAIYPREVQSLCADDADAGLALRATNHREAQTDGFIRKPFGIRAYASDSSRNKRTGSIPNWNNHPGGWHIELWHGWMDAPYLRSQLKSFWQAGTLGEAYLAGRYPAAMGIRMGRCGNIWSWGLQLGYRQHFTWHYQVAELLDERRYTTASVQAWAEKIYFKGVRWSFGGQFSMGVGHQSIQVRAGPERGNFMQNTRLSTQITPLMLRIKHRQWGGFVGMGYGSAGILQTGLSYSPGRSELFRLK